jgi:hypothetical protein
MSFRWFGTIANNNAQYPTVDEEESEGGEPHLGEERAETEELQVVALL